MGKIFLMLSLYMFIGSNSTYAQGSREVDPESLAQKMTERQKERLNLNENQEQQMHVINLNYNQEMHVILQRGRSLQTMMKLKKTRKRKNKDVKKVLNKKKYKEYQEMRKEIKEQLKSFRNISKEPEL